MRSDAMVEIELTDEQRRRWDDDGFLLIDKFLEPHEVEAARSRYPLLFRGEFETGLYPDEWNWKEGRDSDDLARQICNGWKSDYTVARFVLSAQIGRLCAQLLAAREEGAASDEGEPGPLRG